MNGQTVLRLIGKNAGSKTDSPEKENKDSEISESFLLIW